MWRIIAAKEIKAAFSNHVFIVLGLIIWSLLAVACIGGLENFQTASNQRLEATTLFKNELAEKERNPHSAAHFGTYLFKPMTALSLYDPGVNSYTGISYRVEAHKQSEMSLSSVQDSDGVIRFGELSVASIFQLLVPLVIIFLSFSSVSKERQDGTFKILLSQGLSLRALVWGKIAGNYAIILVVIFPCLAFILIKGLFSSESYVNVSLFAISYLLYFLIFTVFSVCTSFVCKSSGTSLLVLLGAWMWFCVISPKITASIASSEYPLQSYYEFSKLVDHDFYNGMDNDGSYEERRKKFEAGVLDKYKVDSISKLPINLDGLMMQDGEDYNSKIYLLRSLPIVKQLESQKAVFRLAAFVTPYITISQLSMTFSGTDLYQNQSFHEQAGLYRDDFVRTLNMELAKSGSPYGTYKYTVSTTFLKNMKHFEFRRPDLNLLLNRQKALLFSIAYWLTMAVLFIEICVKKFTAP